MRKETRGEAVQKNGVRGKGTVKAFFKLVHTYTSGNRTVLYRNRSLYRIVMYHNRTKPVSYYTVTNRIVPHHTAPQPQYGIATVTVSVRTVCPNRHRLVP